MKKKKLVIKIGTSTLTAGTDRISDKKIKNIAKQILFLKKTYDVVVVSSGAIAAAREFVDIAGHKKYIDSKQAMAAIGQPKLMKIYEDIFGEYDIGVAQCLMTYRDFKDKNSKENTKKTIEKLLKYDFLPIINENDTVAVEEIMLGDNDKLSALVASILKADLLIIVSDISGLYDKNPNIHKDAKLINEIKDVKKAYSYIEENKNKSVVFCGGMTSKIEAAEICKKSKTEMWIVSGKKDDFLLDALSGKVSFTKFKWINL